jgi:outer membrane immunogenic protein
MKKLLLGTFALAALMAGPATAADLARPAPVYIPPPPVVVAVFSWTGFYIGGNLGWIGFSGGDLTSAPADPATAAFFGPCIAVGGCPQDYGSAKASGFLGGGQIGYNWQRENFLVGLETDFQGSSANASNTIAATSVAFAPFTGSQSTKENWLGTVRGRLGVIPTPTLLAYVTGGFAYSSLSRNLSGGFPSLAQTFSGSDKSTRTGWTVGTGLEWAMGNGFILGFEYLYVRIKGGSFLAGGLGAGCTAATPCNFNITSSDLTDNIVRVKLNYKF